MCQPVVRWPGVCAFCASHPACALDRHASDSSSLPGPCPLAALIVTSQVDGYLRSLQHLRRTGSFPRPPASAASRPDQPVVDVFPQARAGGSSRDGITPAQAWGHGTAASWGVPCKPALLAPLLSTRISAGGQP